MKNKRKRFTAEEKVKILRLHLIEKQTVSDICDQQGLNPTVFYGWQKQFFEHGAAPILRRSPVLSLPRLVSGPPPIRRPGSFEIRRCPPPPARPSRT